VNRPIVLLERTFLTALIDPTATDHDAAVQCYLDLVDDHVRDRRTLAVSSDHRRELPPVPPDLLAPVDTIHISRRERRAATRVQLGDTDGDRAGLAVHLVLLHRHKIRTLATFDHRYQAYDLTILPHERDRTGDGPL
jgi:predicted nucleic acid-binding protein